MDSKTQERWCGQHDPKAQQAKREQARDAETARQDRERQWRKRAAAVGAAIGAAVTLYYDARTGGYREEVVIDLVDLEKLAERLATKETV